MRRLARISRLTSSEATKQWSRALPAGPRPPGRYGHTLNILGSKIYIFGGQVEGYFFNDLVAFDLNALQQSTNKWEILIQNTIDGGPPHGTIPPARTNHTMITWGDRLYLFGGTDGVHWFNDVWSYSPHANAWTQLECIGYIPSPREGHAAALVGDVMYVFGGRNEEGNDLGDLAAFRISSRRWYTFQNMGPSPSPRSGHSMTTIGKQVVVIGGEPSSAPRDPAELSLGYFLDTSKIRYPPDSASQQSSNERIQGTRRPSGERPPNQVRGQAPRELMERERSESTEGQRIRSPDGSRLPRPGQLPAPSAPPSRPPPGQPMQQPGTRQPSRPERAFSPNAENDRPQRYDATNIAASEGARNSPVHRTHMPMSPTFGEPEPGYYDDSDERAAIQTTHKPETYQPSQQQQQQPAELYQRTDSRTQGNPMLRTEETPRQSEDIHEPMSKVRQMSEETDRPQDSGIGSSPAFAQQNHDELARELENARKQTAWYASELALARKAGYQARSTDSPVLDEKANESFGDDDRPLIEALLKMRSELARVQETIDVQSKSAAERIAEIEKQRDTAINEAVFAKARLAGQGSPQTDGTSTPDRHMEVSRRLASSLEAQSELSRRIDSLINQVEAEKKARELAEDTANAAQKRVAELDSYRQQHSSEIESLRTELHEAQKEAREASANHQEILSQHRLLTVDKDELSRQLESASADGQSHTSILASLREAVTASTSKAELLEKKLEEEHRHRDDIERNLRELKTQHDQRSSELESTTRRLRDAEELAEKHAHEARTHREVVLAGFGKTSERGVDVPRAHEERINVLQQQVEAANAMVRQNQSAADAASEKLRRAEERIAGLEAYQEQASREGLSIRKQLQTYMKENQALTTEKAELEQRMERHMLETNALSVQHASLKDILGERGVNPSEKRRSRVSDSPVTARFSTPDLQRVKELEQQLETNMKNHEDLKTQFEEVNERGDKMKREYEEKLTALDNDHQAAVKYLRGTEKMLSKMKQELQRVKNENGELKKKLDKAKEDTGRSTTPAPNADWQSEREKMKEEFASTQSNLQTSVSRLEGQITTMQEQLKTTESELQQAKTSHTSAQKDLLDLQNSHTQSRNDLERLQKENALLEERAKDAENKVQLLLDQVESSVDNYRRQSRASAGGTPLINGTGHHQRQPSISENSENSGGSATLPAKTHSRNVSAGGESTYSTQDAESTAGDGRNSLALDSLASELDALRTHWETTNKNYRLSDRFDFERTPTQPLTPAGPGGGLADWRRGLELDDDDDATRPGTSKTHSRGPSKDEPAGGLPTPTAATHNNAGGMI